MSYNWRSLLFVPATAQEKWTKAHTRGADAIIVDLEDSTQAEAKAQARWLAPEAVTTLTQNGAHATVRVNNIPEHLEADIEAIVVEGLRAVVMPKVESVQDLQTLSTLIEAAEFECGMERLQVKVIAVIESPRALENIREIADGPRVIGVSLGSEDFALSLGRPPAPLSLALAAQTIAYATSARGLMGLAMASSIANFTDLDAFAAEAKRSYAMGLTGAMCFHPNQVKVLNECFAASEAEIAEAKAILAAWEVRTADVVSHNGKMIDQPVVERARRLLSSQRR